MNGRSHSPRRRSWWLGPLLAVVLAACATSQVKDIADPALAGLPQAALPDPAGTGVPSGSADAAQRIETFIQTHPGITPTTLSSLRIRQGVFYLDQQQPDGAAAAFEAADLASLVTPRDQALKEVAPDLVWWSRTAPLPNLPGVEMKRTAAVMESLSAQIAKRRDSPDIRDYLAEVRAWVGLKYFAALSDRGRQKAVLEDTIDQYATIFTAADLEWLCTPGAIATDVAPEDKRRRLRAQPIVARAAQSAAVLTGPNRPSFRQPVMQALIAPTSTDRVCVRR